VWTINWWNLSFVLLINSDDCLLSTPRSQLEFHLLSSPPRNYLSSNLPVLIHANMIFSKWTLEIIDIHPECSIIHSCPSKRIFKMIVCLPDVICVAISPSIFCIAPWISHLNKIYITMSIGINDCVSMASFKPISSIKSTCYSHPFISDCLFNNFEQIITCLFVSPKLFYWHTCKISETLHCWSRIRIGACNVHFTVSFF